MANPCNSRPPNRPVFAPPQKVLGFALHSHTVKGGKGGVDVGEERGSPGAGPGSPSNAVERSSQCIHNAAQVTAIRCSFLEGPYTACHSRLPKGASRYITMQPQSTTSNPHSQTHCEAKPRVALEDRFVPEKELVKSDWSPLVLDSSTSTLPADSAAASGAVTRPLSGEEIYLHHGLYSKTECEKIIGVAEAAGFGFTVYPKDYRGNLRLVTNDPALAECTWLRMRGTAPPRLQHDGETWEAVGLNPHWRLSKCVCFPIPNWKNITICTGITPATCSSSTSTLASPRLSLCAAFTPSIFT